MNIEIIQMASHALESTQATTLAEKDLASSQENFEKSTADKLSSAEQKEEALAEEATADSLFAVAKQDFTSANELSTQAADEESQAELHQANAAAEEALFESSSEKSAFEAAESGKDQGKTQTDELATGLCSSIPGLDVICDLVGGISSVALQSAAAKWLAESVTDGAEATAEGVKEEKNEASAVEMKSKVVEDDASSVTIHSQANEEKLSAEQDEATAKEDEAESALSSKSSASANSLAKQQKQEASAEETKASEEMKQSKQHGIYAMWNALGSSIMAGLSFLFFVIRIYVAVLLPTLAVLLQFPAFVSTIFCSGATANTTGVNGVTVTATTTTTVQRFHQILHSISYTLLHMGIFYQSILLFSSKFDSFSTINMISRGGIIVLFGILGAALQAFLLHGLKHLVKDYYTHGLKEVNSEENIGLSTNEYSTTRSTTMETNQTPPTVAPSVTSPVISFLAFLRAFVYLTPLFIIETLIIWLLFGTSTFLFSSTAAGTTQGISSSNFISKMITPWRWACLLVLVVMFHYWVFEINDASNDIGIENDMNDNEMEKTLETVLSSTASSPLGDGFDQEQQPLLDSVHRNTSSTYYGGLKNPKESSDPSNAQSNISNTRIGTTNTFAPCLSSHSSSVLGTTLSNMGVTSASYRNIFTTKQIMKAQKMERKQPPILKKQTTIQSQTNPIQKYILKPLYNYLLDIQLPFEILLLISAYLLIQNTTPVLKKLWPTFYNIILKSFPRYYWGVIGGSITIVGLFWWKCCGGKGGEDGRRHPNLGVLTGDTLRRLEIQV